MSALTRRHHHRFGSRRGDRRRSAHPGRLVGRHHGEGSQPSAGPRRPRPSWRRTSPTTRSSSCAATSSGRTRSSSHAPSAIGRRRRAHSRRRGELHPDDGRRRRHPRRRRRRRGFARWTSTWRRPTGPSPTPTWPTGRSSYDDLEPYYATSSGRSAWPGPTAPIPSPPGARRPIPMPLGRTDVRRHAVVGRRRAAGLPSLPRRPRPPTACPTTARPACNNCGFCAFFGCPIHAKGDPVALLQRTMATGRAELRAETFVTRIRTRRRAGPPGCDFIGPDGVERSMDARAT